ncbi:DNA-directed RNA polymerase subunit omega [Malaciobacter marinus]|jgi:DNA-directed RNA polymerase subunit omega|uniref:DNA-directed RNA polymerase subunit omega n=1 Tax=Malaciobacter marinus TaxID=505249 RepID=A0A1T5C8V2_9BACT|nr:MULTISPECIES: DNA-directed RNA polymerase subunit omega [Malaciobacter]AXX86601.1 DNA-directed RNA polymerase, omega subunit [Malaciobacter marinus]PHO12549.1 DNA-directed RNA polymerase subunit omega [Malaciobacter marinus]PHO16441.1 DNA-directed RNA polymerase subunit omega [Malaciobacter marinus]RYA23711.1 DNA-directed RNA polymerase subunit omega [Malaciobacter halophilus]SKB55793.1 DNA-directed RNA polymerase subunit omega [Malaciobacter marinus]
MLRLEERMAKALEKVNNDRYILSIAVGQRADDLSKGAKPLLEQNTQNMKYTDIAIDEIANGLLVIEGLIDKED